MRPTVADTLELTAEKYPATGALVYPRKDQSYTFAELDEPATRLANALADLGVEKGDGVSTMLFNGTEIVLTVYACGKLGAVFNPLNYRLPAGELEFVCNDAAPRVLLFEADTRGPVATAREGLKTVEEFVYDDDDVPEYADGFYEILADAPAEPPGTAVDADDVYAFIYTSRTTGRPKGVVHEHRDMVEHDLICIAEGDLPKDDVGLSALPLYHCGELHANLLPRVDVGAASVVHYSFDPVAVLDAIDEHDMTLFFAAPTAWHALAGAAESVEADTSSLRLGLYGASPMPEEVLDACME